MVVVVAVAAVEGTPETLRIVFEVCWDLSYGH